MNFKEYTYSIIKTALSNITGATIIDSYLQKDLTTTYIYIEVGALTEKSIFSEYDIINSDGQFEVKIVYGYISKKNENVNDDIRKKTGDLYDQIRYELIKIGYPKQYEYKIATVTKVQYTINGISDIGLENDLLNSKTNNKEDNLLTVIFDYNVNYF